MSEKTPRTRYFRHLAVVAIAAAAGVALLVAAAPAPAALAAHPADTIAAAAPPAPPAPPASPAAPAPPAPRERDHRGWLGVVLSDQGDGVVIRSVVGDSPADEAGLKRGDRIVEFEGRRIDESDDLMDVMRGLRPGDRVKIKVDRDGSQETLSATLGESKRRMVQRFEWKGEGDDDMDGPNVIFNDEGGHGHHQFMVLTSGPMLGVEILPMSEDLRAHFRAPKDSGLLVNRVVKDSPADRGGVRAGDVILEVDGQEISDSGDIRDALSDHKAGDRVPVKVVRDGNDVTLDVTLDEEHSFGHPRHGAFYVGPDAIGIGEGVVSVDEEEIQRAVEEAQRALKEAMEEMHLQMKEQHEKQKEMEQEIREKLEELDHDQQETVTRVHRVVTYDI